MISSRTMALSTHSLFTRNLDAFAPKCPTDSAWYACPASSGSTFVGCCASNPCANKNGCSQGNIRPGSFNGSSHGTPDFPPDASCGTGSNFYTCVGGSAGDAVRKTFWGCCKSNPCANTVDPQTCPVENLTPAYMGTPTQVQAYTGEGASSASPSPSASPNTSPSASPSAEANSKTTNTAVIVGGAVGGAVVVVLIVSILIFCLCRRRKASRASSPTPMAGTDAAGRPEKSAAYNGQFGNPIANDEAPPNYTSPKPNAHPPVFPSKQGYQYVSPEPQEAPVELPAGSSRQRYSELPAENHTSRIAEMESPVPSPRLVQSRFSGPGSPSVR